MPSSPSTLREDVVDAALRLLAAEGADAISVRRIARDLGVSAGAAYYHFEDKGALYREIVAEGLREIEAAVTAAAAPTLGPADRLRAVAAAYARFALDHPEHYYVFLMLRDGGIPAMSEEQTAAGLRVLALVAGAIAEGTESGAFRPAGDFATEALGLWSALHGTLSLAVAGRLQLAAPGLAPEALVDAAVGRALRALAPPGGEVPERA